MPSAQVRLSGSVLRILTSFLPHSSVGFYMLLPLTASLCALPVMFLYFTMLRNFWLPTELKIQMKYIDLYPDIQNLQQNSQSQLSFFFFLASTSLLLTPSPSQTCLFSSILWREASNAKLSCIGPPTCQALPLRRPPSSGLRAALQPGRRSGPISGSVLHSMQLLLFPSPARQMYVLSPLDSHGAFSLFFN